MGWKCCLTMMIWLLSAPLAAALVLGISPDQQTTWSQSKDLELFAQYLSTQMGDVVLVEKAKSCGSLMRELKEGRIAFALIANAGYREHAHDLSLVANYTKSRETTTHRLLLLVAANSEITTPKDLWTKGGRLGLDYQNASRIYFVTAALNANPFALFSEMVAESRIMDLLNGLIGGQFRAVCLEDSALDAIRRFDPGLVRRVTVLKTSQPFASDPLVMSRTADPDLLARLQSVLWRMEEDVSGRQVLLSLRISRFIAPLTDLSVYPQMVTVQEREATPREINPSPGSESAPEKSGEAVAQDPPKVLVPSEEPTLSARPQPIALEPQPLKSPEIETPIPKETVSSPQSEDARPEWVPGPSEKTPLAPARKTTEFKDLPLLEETVDHTRSLKPMLIFLSLLLVFGGGLAFWLIQSKKKNAPARVAVNARIQDPPEKETPGRLEEKAFRGELKTLGPLELLQLMASARETGILTVTHRSFGARIRLHQGKAVAAARLEEASPYRLGTLLCRLGHIREPQLRRALAKLNAQPTSKLGRTLIKEGDLTTSALKTTLKFQTTEVLYSLFFLSEGQFELQRCAVNWISDEEEALEIQPLILEGSHRRDVFDQVTRQLGGLDSILTKTQGTLESLTPALEKTLSRIDGQTTLQSLIHSPERLEYETLTLLASLYQKGWISAQSS